MCWLFTIRFWACGHSWTCFQPKAPNHSHKDWFRAETNIASCYGTWGGECRKLWYCLLPDALWQTADDDSISMPPPSTPPRQAQKRPRAATSKFDLRQWYLFDSIGRHHIAKASCPLWKCFSARYPGTAASRYNIHGLLIQTDNSVGWRIGKPSWDYFPRWW